jgi:hypothetical protein
MNLSLKKTIPEETVVIHRPDVAAKAKDSKKEIQETFVHGK